jgi:hypothetical protein
MKQQSKLHLMAFLVATLLAVGGLVAMPHSAYAGFSPPNGSGPIRFSESTIIVLDPADLAATPHGISTSPGHP